MCGFVDSVVDTVSDVVGGVGDFVGDVVGGVGDVLGSDLGKVALAGAALYFAVPAVKSWFSGAGTTAGLAEGAAAYGTDLSAVDAFNAGDIFYGAGETLTGGATGGAAGAAEASSWWSNTYDDLISAGVSPTDANDYLQTMVDAPTGAAGYQSGLGWVDAQGFPISLEGAAGIAGVAGAGGGVLDDAAKSALIYNALGGGGANVPSRTALGRILEGRATTDDWLSILGTAGATGLGVYAANRQTDLLENLSKEYSGYGAPYRQKLTDLYANPSGFLSSPEVQVPVQQGTDAAARALSAKVGNPVFSGTALQELQNYSANQLFGKLGQEKDRLAGFGGLSNYSAAAPGAATNAINSSGNALTTLAGGISDIVNPRQSLTDLMKMFQGNNLFGVA